MEAPKPPEDSRDGNLAAFAFLGTYLGLFPVFAALVINRLG